MTTIRTSGLIDEYARAMGLQTLSREIELNSEDVERRLVEVRRQHPEDTPEQQYARAVARELWFNYPRLRRSAPAELPQVPPPPPEVQAVTLRLTMWQKLLLYLWMAVALGLLGVIAARGQGGQGPMIEVLDEGLRVRFFAAGVFRWNCIGANIACTWNAGTRRIDLTIAGGGAAHNILSATHLDSVAAAAVRGDLIAADATPAWARLPRGAANEVLTMNPAGTDPIWAALPAAGAHNFLSATHTDTVAAAPVRGDMIVGSAVPDWQRFARGAANQVLRMNPAGTDPAWDDVYGVANLTAVGIGGFWGGVIHNPNVAAPTAVLALANQVKALRFVLPFQITVRGIIYRINTVSAGGLVDVGIYDAAGNNKLLSSGPQSTAVAVTINVAIAPVVLPAGVYWQAFGIDNVVARLEGIQTSTDAYNLIMNATTVHWGIAANPLVAGTLPAALGVIATSMHHIPAVWYEP